ncbi:expressed unknown protein [Seminavis robusta]|uniref:Uncharacterized protein n=1 Tax=Seminavis robusta TaxID=568900 RepID=A0A9N8EW15_9STRA|nr:expressed unknown protein [Seminavis robusta]|eukprot:Sro2068_g313340.1 n/a (207) ;mRNA; r:12172-12792
MGGSPVITESSSMVVSSPLHVTTSLQERLVKTPPAFDSRAGVHVTDHKSDDGRGFFETPLSDDSNNDRDTVLLFRPSKPRDGSFVDAKHVAFGSISTRCYDVVMGDHPCCSMGCPLALGWEYSQDPSVSVDVYEASRSPRRSKADLKTTWEQRRNMLSDVSDGEVKRAERKLHRERSCQRKVRSRVSAAFFQMDGIPEETSGPQCI